MNSLVFYMALVPISPLLVCYWVTSLLVGCDGAVETYSQLLSWIPGRFGVKLRAAFFSTVLADCDRSVFIGFGALLTKFDTKLGRHVYIGPYCQLGWVSIGNDTLLGPAVQVPSGPKSHTFDSLEIPIRNQAREPMRVQIGVDCWVGAGAIIMADLGDQAVVGAGSVVTKPVAPRVLAAGVPCEQIRPRGLS